MKNNKKFYEDDRFRDKNGKRLNIGDKCKCFFLEGTIYEFVLTNQIARVGVKLMNEASTIYCRFNPKELEKIELES